MVKRSFRFFQSIYFKIPLLFIFILLIAFQFIGVFFIDRLETQSVESYEAQIRTQTDFLTNNLVSLMEQYEQASDDQAVKEATEQISQTLETFTTPMSTRLQVINTDETLIATDFNSGLVDVGTQVSDPAVRNVLLTATSSSSKAYDNSTSRYSYTLIRPILSTSTEQNNQVLGAVVVEADMTSVYRQTDRIIDIFIQSIGLAVGVALLVSVFLSQGLTRPLETIRQQAIRISEGIYNYPAEVYGNDELGELAITVNELADKVRDAQESTESERQRLDGILRHMTDGVIGTDQHGNVLLVNDRALYLLDVHQEKAIGKNILRLLGIDQNYSMTDFWHGDNEVLITTVDDGAETILKGEFSVIRRETGFVTGLVCVLTDVTEQEKCDQERRDFVSNVSHELRTPLTSLKSYSDALAEGAWQDENLAPQFIEVIQSESDRMIRMIANLLDLSKIDGGQIVLNRDFIEFKRLVNYILDRLNFTLESGELFEGRQYHIIRDFTNRDIYVDIDQDRMTQVIDNLLNNALKYSPDGGTIRVRIVDNHKSVVFSVEDEGLGISQSDLEHLFERFYRVDKARSREQGGSGLGLAITKEVIELHGGRIWVDSVEGEGSTFSFEIPYSSYDELSEEWY
ncbi:cell wall metabolism sensor histidine kinase WalK [Hutsoniella sourekii]|uniref:cell wall metabolism sensor histidine kinase WalK n=1 Tax=Hutsoniella sourekii TaxID=87650 RepID=UPI000480FCF3|nr:cell wall metabolism sensor histidine kinase WalK [Hutsoniella sourekii]